LSNSSLNRKIENNQVSECPICFIKIESSTLEDHYGECVLNEQEAVLTEKYSCNFCSSLILVTETETHSIACAELLQIKNNLHSIEGRMFPIEWGKTYTSFEQKSIFL